MRTKVLLLVVLALSLAAVQPASAGFTDEVLDTEEDLSIREAVSAAVSFAKGMIERVSDFRDSEGWDPGEEAADLKEYYNQRSSSFEDYVNGRTTATTSHDVVEIELSSADDSSTVYLVSDVNGSNYENSSIVDDTDRDVDGWVTLCGSAGKNAKEEMKEFYETFVEEDENVTRSYMARKNGRYGGKATTSLLDQERCEA